MRFVKSGALKTHETANNNVQFRPQFAVGITNELIKSRRIARTRSDYASVLMPIDPDKDTEIRTCTHGFAG